MWEGVLTAVSDGSSLSMEPTAVVQCLLTQRCGSKIRPWRQYHNFKAFIPSDSKEINFLKKTASIYIFTALFKTTQTDPKRPAFNQNKENQF